MYRRMFLILSLLYMYRAITMFVTVMPVSSTTYYCSPKSNETTPLEVTKRIIHLFTGLGLSVNGKHTFCGDYIYSGHTVILVFCYLFISECECDALSGKFCLSSPESMITIQYCIIYHFKLFLFFLKIRRRNCTSCIGCIGVLRLWA